MTRFSFAQKAACGLLVTGAFAGGFAGDVFQTAAAQVATHPLAAWHHVQTRTFARAARLTQLVPAAAQNALPHIPQSSDAAANQDKGEVSPPEVCADVLSTIKGNFYSPSPPPDPTKLTYSAIDGMLATIKDPYTVFFTPDEYKDITAENEGNFVGIGTRLDLNRDHQVVVVEPIEGSPAQKAGIQAGDVFIAVNHKSVVGQTMTTVADLIRGSENSRVSVTVARRGKPLTFALRRGLVHSPIVHSRMENEPAKIGYIALAQFNEQADAQFDAALAKLEKEQMRGLIFDLRDNPGGLLNVAQDVASRFVEKGPVVWVTEKNGQLSSMDVEKNKHRSPLYKGAYPVVVLVNGGSASASEIVAGAIQDARMGTLLGTTTYGKGLVQTIIPLADDSAVKITTQHYFTRNKHDINKKHDANGRQISGGILPDVVVSFDEKAENIAREVLRRDPQNWAAADTYDGQMQKALAILEEKLAAKP